MEITDPISGEVLDDLFALIKSANLKGYQVSQLQGPLSRGGVEFTYGLKMTVMGLPFRTASHFAVVCR